MLHNIFKYISPEKWSCYSIWGYDVQSLLTFIQEYYAHIPGKTLVIPTSPFKLKFKTEAHFVDLSGHTDETDEPSELFILAERNQQNDVQPASLQALLEVSSELQEKYVRVIFINLLKNEETISRFFYSLKEGHRLFPETGLIITSADKYNRNFIVKESRLNHNAGNEVHLLGFKLDELTRMKLFPVYVIFMSVSSFGRENEITLVGKELVTNGVSGIFYYLDDRCHFIGEKI